MDRHRLRVLKDRQRQKIYYARDSIGETSLMGILDITQHEYAASYKRNDEKNKSCLRGRSCNLQRSMSFDTNL
jgi:hypothetical protein